MTTDTTDVLSGFSSAIDLGSGFSRYGSVKLRWAF